MDKLLPVHLHAILIVALTRQDEKILMFVSDIHQPVFLRDSPTHCFAPLERLRFTYPCKKAVPFNVLNQVVDFLDHCFIGFLPAGLQACSVLSFQVHKDDYGIIVVRESKLPEKEIKVTRLFAALRGNWLADLCSIRKNGTRAYGVENDILTTLKTLETKKNLLLFFSYQFTFDKHHDYDEAIKSISEALTDNFHVAFKYRNNQTQGQFDTFITCIYDHSFLIFSIKDQIVQLIDTVKTKEVKTFLQLSDYTDWWEYNALF